MKKVIFAIVAVTCFLSTQAQQIPLLSHYYYNKFVWNPALSGFQKYGQAYLIYRDQWSKMPEAPQTKAFTIDGPLRKKNIGLGANIYQDNAGIFNRTGGMISYAYGITLNEESALRFGLGVGFIDNRIDFAKILAKHPGDQLLINTYQNKTGFDANFGINYTIKGFNIGLAVPQVLSLDTKFANPSASDAVYTNSRHFQINTSYLFKFSEDKIKFEPSAFLRVTPHAPFQVDVNTTFSYLDMLYAGLTYRSGYAIASNIGLRLQNQFFVGYSHDFAINNYKTYIKGANEIMIGYQFGATGIDEDELKKRFKGIDDKLDADKTRIDDLDKRTKGNTDDIDDLKTKTKKNTDDIDGHDKDIDELRKTFETLKSRLGTGSVAVGDVYSFENVYFATNSYELSSAATAELNELVTIMKDNPAMKIEVSGHTDERGSAEYNQKLSERRSNAVRDYLIRNGISGDRLSIYSFGEEKPAVQEDLAKNRRVEFKVLEK